MIRYDNFSVAEHVRSANSSTKRRAVNGFLDSNREALRNNPLLALARRVMRNLNIPDEVAKTSARDKLILLLVRRIPQNDIRWGEMR